MARSHLINAKEIIEAVVGEEEDVKENIPDSFVDKHEESEQCISAMDEALSSVEEAIKSVEEAL
jgi:t-SNARE complex subunit (syntaxin)